MKKLIFLIIIILTITFLKDNQTNEIRIRILANSDELCDQKEKIIVKETLIKILNNQKNITNLLENDLNKIKIELKNNLETNLFQKLKIEYKKVNFPAKSKNGKILKAGTYQTLLITIKSGKGKNWWSVLYPEFFNIEYDENNEIEYKLFLKEYLKNQWKICENVWYYLQ